MVTAFLVAAQVAAASPPVILPQPSTTAQLSEAAQAIAANRLGQARRMIASAVAKGEKGPAVERLLADLDYAAGKNAEALARYEQLLASGAAEGPIFERAGIAALKLGLVDKASALIARAVEAPDAGWRSWNARGVAADLQSDWATAASAYERALVIGPDQAEILNNRGWSALLQGNWSDAVQWFERAYALKPRGKRIANNLDLARSAVADGLPQRRPNESPREWAARLNDAALAAHLSGNRAKAVAGFTQALEASNTWYERAANNLAAVTAAE